MIKSFSRGLLRAYLTYTPIKKGRYPIMMFFHKYLTEPLTVQIKTNDRGIMIIDLQDETQFPVYYNLYEGVYLETMKSLLERTNIVLDVGGNIGQYALLFANYAKRVYVFEPMPRMIERLKKVVTMNNLSDKVVIVDKALSNKAGKLQLSVPLSIHTGVATTVLSDKKITYSDQDLREHIEKNISISDKGEIETIEIDAIKFDDFMTAEKIDSVDIVKMDIEGSELFALQGMTTLLSKPNKPMIIIEMNDVTMRLAGYHFKDVTDFLSPYGYEAYEITKKGLLHTPEIHSKSENYCFLTLEHLKMEKVKRVLL